MATYKSNKPKSLLPKDIDTEYFIRVEIKNRSMCDQIETIRGLFMISDDIINKFDIVKTNCDDIYNYYLVNLYTTIDKDQVKVWISNRLKFTVDYCTVL